MAFMLLSVPCRRNLPNAPAFQTTMPKKIKAVLTKLFEGDASSARPEGSMEVVKLIWWEHNCKAGQYSSAKVHGKLRDMIEEKVKTNTIDQLIDAIKKDSLTLKEDGTLLEPEIIDGF